MPYGWRFTMKLTIEEIVQAEMREIPRYHNAD